VNWTLRAAKELDVAYLRSSWLDSAKQSFEAVAAGAPWLAAKKKQIIRLLRDPASRVTVAHVPDDEDAIVGWAVRRGNLLLYAYVRPEMRRMGIGKAVMGSGVVAYAHRALRHRAPKAWKYEPERLE
jgi:GNAT superfamily N-acetyltransferase